MRKLLCLDGPCMGESVFVAEGLESIVISKENKRLSYFVRRLDVRAWAPVFCLIYDATLSDAPTPPPPASAPTPKPDRANINFNNKLRGINSESLARIAFALEELVREAKADRASIAEVIQQNHIITKMRGDESRLRQKIVQLKSLVGQLRPPTK